MYAYVLLQEFVCCPSHAPTNMCVYVSPLPSIGLHVMVIALNVNMCVCVLWCRLLYVSIYKLTTVSKARVGFRISPISDVGTFGVIGGGGGWHVATSLFGIVEAVVVLVGVRGG